MNISRIARFHAVPAAATILLAGQLVRAAPVGAAPTRQNAPASLKTLVLTTRDISRVYGGQFRAFINGVISNADLASAEKSAGASSGPSMTTTGRVTGYDSVWLRGSRTNYLSVTSSVNVYRNSSFPQAAFRQFGRFKPAHSGLTFHVAAVGGLGDQAALLTVTSHGITERGLIFRRGQYLAEIFAAVRTGKVSVSNVSKLAVIEDQRIRARG